MHKGARDDHGRFFPTGVGLVFAFVTSGRSATQTAPGETEKATKDASNYPRGYDGRE